jgi:reverse gyrase
LGKGLFIHLPKPKELEELDRIINTSKNIYRAMEAIGLTEEDVLNHLRESYPEIEELKKVKKLEDAAKLLKEKAWQERGKEIMKKVFYFRVLPDGSILEFRERG